ncbi:response regulator transcription factor [Geomonas agri]|uniref:response regulator transcription factor n=1 Tax=Geomonas agri TaxID=2873702 RepID=UPI001CD4BFE7|nr:response regulator transcription factor [Geomonas agri]
MALEPDDAASGKILIVDDDEDLCSLLRDLFHREGFAVEAVHNGAAGAERAIAGSHALVVLDVMLPGMSGFEVLRRIRASSPVPVLMLTARGEDVDRIVGLEIGADDYLPKPFNPRELVARIRAVLRRTATSPPLTSPGVPPEATRLSVGDVELIGRTRTVLRAGEKIELTTVEFALLEVLLRLAGQVVSRDELVRQGMGRTLNAYDRSVDVHVGSLRRKLGPLPGGGERIKTVRNIGYHYSVEDPL